MRLSSQITLLLVVLLLPTTFCGVGQSWLKPFTAAGSSSKCSENQFLCLGGACISQKSVCNGKFDCPDKSDEANCVWKKCENSDFVQCQDSRCIANSSLCNGVVDCVNGEDEMNCENTMIKNSCPLQDYRCSSGACVPPHRVCDGYKDCPDGADETAGCREKTECSQNEFMCANHTCIQKIYRCDGFKDCVDNSDEEYCYKQSINFKNCTIENAKFLCKDNFKCIDFHQVCDKKIDCIDKSDESDATCHIIYGGRQNSNGSYECHSTVPDSPCECQQGYKLHSNSCVDIDECQIFGSCDQKCNNTHGSYICSCHSSYALQEDKHSCKILGGEALLLFTANDKIGGLFLKSFTNFTIVSDVQYPLAITSGGKFIYWTVPQPNSWLIMRALHDGTEAEPIVTSGISSPEVIAVDWYTMNIYFTEAKKKFISVCTKDGYSCASLHVNNLDKPRAIALSPEHGIMFWTDWGKFPMIGRSGMDGSKAVAFVTENVYWPSGVTIDIPTERIYWIENKLNTIETINFDQTGRRTILNQLSMKPFSIAVFENQLYWNDLDGSEILSCNKFTGRQKQVLLREPVRRFYSLSLHHPLLQTKTVENPCSRALCTDLCLLAPRQNGGLNYTCACSEDNILAKDGYKCVSKGTPSVLLASVEDHLYIIEYHSIGRPQIQDIKLKNKKITAITYDCNQKSVIMFDAETQVIFSYNLESKLFFSLATYGLGLITSLHFDEIGNNLYWCDWQSLTVELLSLNTHSRMVITSRNSLATPYDIALAPDQNYLFVTFIIMYESVEIHRYSMSGSIVSKKLLVEIPTASYEVKLHYSRELKRLFFMNSHAGTIESVDVNGDNRREHQKGSTGDSFTLLDRTIFWTNSPSPFIMSQNFDEFEVREDIRINNKDIVDGTSILLATVTDYNVSGSPCHTDNGGCSHICLVGDASHRNRLCACPSGLALSLNDRTCIKPKNCSSNEYECLTGECINFHKVCDGREDCVHGDDERKILCDSLQCPAEQFLCSDRQKCIDNRRRCDGVNDCADKSDEICNYNCTSESGKFWCHSGECIDVHFRCDDKVDCKDGYDEMNCHQVTCDRDEFRCKSGQCIPKEWECDSEQDCVDATDESPKCHGAQCFSDEFQCDNKKCIDLRLVCNKFDDCGDDSDEIFCSKEHHTGSRRRYMVMCNPHSEFHCSHGQQSCMPMSVRCNGSAECADGSDEKNCTVNLCIPGEEFHCAKLNKCIPLDWVCDGSNDCEDNSDEVDTCAKKIIQSKKCLNFQCNSGECLPLRKVCDNIPDCKDRSDEGKHCGIPCEKYGCQYKCLQTPNGPTCFCPNGFRLDKNKKNCIDINECDLNVCAQDCTNLNGSFKCSCFVPNYVLRSDRVSCKARGDPTVYVVASDVSLDIFSNNLKHKTELNLGTNLFRTIRGIDVDSVNKIVFVLLEDDYIWRVPLISSENNEPKQLPGITSFAYDWITENIYYVKNHVSIKITTWNSSKSVEIRHTNFEKYMWALSVDPYAGYVFWFESHSNIDLSFGSIKRADNTGANIITLDEGLNYGIRQMVVDSFGKHIYWIDRLSHCIRRQNYDGTHGIVFLQFDTDAVTFTYFESSIYWVSRHPEKFGIKKCKIYGLPPFKCETVKMNLDYIHYLSIMQDNRQRTGPNPCVKAECSGICITSPDGPMCKNFNGSLIPLFQSGRRETSVGRSTNFWTIIAYIVIISLIVCLGVGLYCYNCKPKSNVWQSVNFHNPIYDQPIHSDTALGDHSPILSRSYSVHENPLSKEENVTLAETLMSTQKCKIAFLETLPEEPVDSDYNVVTVSQTTAQSLIQM